MLAVKFESKLFQVRIFVKAICRLDSNLTKPDMILG